MDTITTPQETTALVVATPTPHVSPEILEQVLIGGDLSGLTEAQRLLSFSLLSKPFEYLWLNGKLRLYALRDCADQLRRLHGISITITSVSRSRARVSSLSRLSSSRSSRARARVAARAAAFGAGASPSAASRPWAIRIWAVSAIVKAFAWDTCSAGV